MNPMMAALQASRKDAQVAPDAPAMPGKPKDAGNPGEMMSQKMMSMDSKLDQILKLLSGKAPADEAKENEPNGNGNGY